VGYDGLADFKLKLAGTVNEGVPFVHRSVDEDDGPSELIVKVIDNAVSAMLKYRNNAASHAFERAIAALTESGTQKKRIDFYGVGNSGIVAQDAQHKFFRLGVATAAYSDPHVHAMAASMLGRGDVVVAISGSGRTRDLIRSAEIAREAGATVIAITVAGSPLAKVCDIGVFADVPEDPDVYAPMTSRLAHLAIFDVLAVGVAVARGPELDERLRRAKAVITEKRFDES
jgi:RpiR family carbohydrate utilization transcriptional regulator